MKPYLQQAGKLSITELCTLAVTGGLMFAAKVALAFLPNISLNAVIIILLTVCFGLKAMYAVALYVMLEGLVYGFGVWWISYLYIWPLLVCIVLLMRKNESALIWAALAAGFGLCFGALCAIPYIFISGIEFALSYWVGGIPYDLLHCGGNFVTTLVLYKPLRRVFDHFAESKMSAM